MTLGARNGGAPYVKKGARLCSHSIILGGVTVGENSIVAPGAVLIDDVDDGMIAAGVPAKVIGKATDSQYDFWENCGQMLTRLHQLVQIECYLKQWFGPQAQSIMSPLLQPTELQARMVSR